MPFFTILCKWTSPLLLWTLFFIKVVGYIRVRQCAAIAGCHSSDCFYATFQTHKNELFKRIFEVWVSKQPSIQTLNSYSLPLRFLTLFWRWLYLEYVVPERLLKYGSVHSPKRCLQYAVLVLLTKTICLFSLFYDLPYWYLQLAGFVYTTLYFFLNVILEVNWTSTKVSILMRNCALCHCTFLSSAVFNMFHVTVQLTNSIYKSFT